MKQTLVLAGGVVSFVVLALNVAGGNLLTASAILIAAVVGYYGLVFVHELGHAVIGMTAGLPLRWFAVGPVMVDFTHGRRWHVSPFKGIAGGLVLFDVEDVPDDDLGDVLARLSAGGPLASLLFAVLCFGGWSTGLGLPSEFGTVFLLLGLGSLLTGIVNAIPLRIGPFRSDGSTFFTLYRGGPAAESYLRTVRLTEPMTRAERPAEWPAPLVARLHQILQGTETPRPECVDEWLSAASMLYWFYLDQGKVAWAEAVLVHIARIPRHPAVSPRRYEFIHTQIAVHLLLYRGDLATADAYAALVSKQSTMRRNTLWVGLEAARALARGDAATALKGAKRAQRLLAPHVELMGVNVPERDQWTALIARAEAALASTDAATAAAYLPIAAPTEQAPIWHPPVGATPAGSAFPTTATPAASPRVQLPAKPVPVALAKAIGALVALGIAYSLLFFGMIFIAFVIFQDMETIVGGYVGMLDVALLQVAIAVWIWRQAGISWGVLSLVALPLTLPIYVYEQNRGMAQGMTGLPVRPFRTLATFGTVALASVLATIGAIGITAFFTLGGGF